MNPANNNYYTTDKTQNKQQITVSDLLEIIHKNTRKMMRRLTQNAKIKRQDETAKTGKTENKGGIKQGHSQHNWNYTPSRIYKMNYCGNYTNQNSAFKFGQQTYR